MLSRNGVLMAARADHIDPAERMDHFAELLSLDLTTAEIAERMGIKRTRATQMLAELKRKYGWQAQ
jgi:DNA-binding transcriptional regulator LsrR (DeoR family)